jgi:hypothetical protein
MQLGWLRGQFSDRLYPGETGSYALALLPLVLIAGVGCVAVLLLGSGQPLKTSTAAAPSLH